MSKSKQSSLDSFFSKPHDSNTSYESSRNVERTVPPSEASISSEQRPAVSHSMPTPPAFNDIGYAVGRSLTTEERRQFLQPWIPSTDAAYPSSSHQKGGKERCRRLLPHHLKDFPWLAVSRVPGKEGAFCVPCVLFNCAQSVGGRGVSAERQKVGNLVIRPLMNFSNLTGSLATNGSLTGHAATQYHLHNVATMENFRRLSFNTKIDIQNQLDDAHAREVERNRAILRPIIDTILLCARQNIPLRGHRYEDGSVSPTGEDPLKNDGNFRALLRFRIRSGDTKLEEHARSASRNATYHSPRIQNAVICCAGELVKEAIVTRIKEADFWSIIADETMDRKKREQLAVAIRYVKKTDDEWHVYEDTVSILDIFTEIKSNCLMKDDEGDEIQLSGITIGEILLRVVKKLDLDLNKCVGQSYDGASSMASARVGASAKFLEEAHFGFYSHCASHCLNLSAAQVVTVPDVSNAQSIIKEVSSVFRSSAKRTDLLKRCIDRDPKATTNKRQLTTLCTTRFVEQHSAVITLRRLLPYVVEALDEMRRWSSSATRSSANTLLNSICTSGFLISLVALENVSATLLPATRFLQSPGIDLVEAMHCVSMTISELEAMRSEDLFEKLFLEASAMASILDFKLSKPRVPASRSSIYRPTAGSSDCSIDAYYRINLWYPVLDSVINDMKLRFGASQMKALGGSKLIPGFMSPDEEDDWSQIQSTFGVYSPFFDDPEIVVKAEYSLWRRSWINVAPDQKPKTAVAALQSASSLFPNMQRFLQLLATLPITSIEAERLFSKMEATLTAIRATMQEDRLESLLLLHVHRDLCPSIDDIIDRFSVTHARRLSFHI